MACEQLCNADDVKDAWAGFANLSATRQTHLINTASGKILKATRRKFFAAQFRNELKSGRNTAVLWLDCRPVKTVAQITVGVDPLDPTAGNILTNADGRDWTVFPSKGKIVRGPDIGQERFAWAWPAGSNNILVQYWAGFDSVPDQVIEATVQLVKWLQQQNDAIGVYSSESLGDWSGTLAAGQSYMGLPLHVADLIMDYVQDDGPV